MLSRLGGAAMASSGPACSLDSWSGNSRQDETHPDTLTAQALPTVTVKGRSLAQNILFFFFFLTLVVKTSDSGARKEKCWLFVTFHNQLHIMSLVVFSVDLFSVLVGKEIKPKEKKKKLHSLQVHIDFLKSLLSVLCNLPTGMD